MTDLNKAIEVIKTSVKDPKDGLGNDVFYLVSELTPLVNVDLFIQNEAGEILLTWRDDQFYGPGWHFPGGILRFKETLSKRLNEVALSELNTRITFSPTPLLTQQAINPERDTRGHFISILYACELSGPLDPTMAYVESAPSNDQWAWHKEMPQNLIKVHKHLYSTVFKTGQTYD